MALRKDEAMRYTVGVERDGYVYTVYGWVEIRKPGEPAPIRCEGLCGLESRVPITTMHVWSHRTANHDMYKCVKCEHERVWG